MTQHSVSEPGEPFGYLSAHLRPAGEGIRQHRGRKTWRTFGAQYPVDRGAKILDIGPGECDLARELAELQGYSAVSVIDTSEEVVHHARARGVTAFHVEDSVQYLLNNPASYDVVSLFHVLEHVPKQSAIPLVTSIFHALRPGGRLLIEVPNMGDPLNGLYYRYADFTHEIGYTEESLAYVLRQSGFTDHSFLRQVGSLNPAARFAQLAAQRALHLLLYMANLPNGRQMRRNTCPYIAVAAIRNAP